MSFAENIGQGGILWSMTMSELDVDRAPVCALSRHFNIGLFYQRSESPVADHSFDAHNAVPAAGRI